MAQILDFTINVGMLMSGNFNSASSQASQKMAQLQSRAQALAASSRKLQDFKNASTTLTTLRDKLNAAQTRVRTLRTEIANTPNPTQKMRTEFTRANIEAAKLQQAVQKQAKSVGELRSSLRDAGVDTAHLGSEEDRLRNSIDRVTQSQNRLNQAQDKYSQLRNKLSLDSMKGDILASAATVKAFQKPIAVNMEFEQAMAQVRAVAMPSQDEYMRLENQAKELGRSTQFSATQAANSQEILMRAGLNTEQVMQTLPAVLNMASAEGMEIAQAADLLVNATKAMKYDVSMMPIVSDILAYTSAHSNTNIAQLAEAMQIAAPAASDIGMPIEQLASLLGAMSSTKRGAEAGTALASTISRLAKAPKQVSESLAALGVATQTREGNAVEIPEVIRMVEEKLASMGKMQAENYRSKIYGQFAPSMSGLAAGIKSGEQETLELGAYTERNGASMQMSRIRNDTLKGDITALSSAWEGLMIKIGEALTPINRFLTQTLTTGIQKFTALLEQHKSLVDWALRVGYAFAGWKIVSTAGKYAGALLQLPGALLEVRRAADAAGQTLGSLGLITKTGTVLQWLWNTALNANPIALVTTAVMGLVTGIAVLYHNWDAVKLYAGSVAEFALDKWNEFAAWWDSFTLGDIFAPLVQFAADTVNYLKAPFVAFGEWLMEKFSKLNPFNWELPSWLGGGNSAQQVSNANTALGGYTPPEIRNAKGGIYSRPIWTWAAEDGAEAIIPLTDKSRGIPLVMQAAQILGLNHEQAAPVVSASRDVFSSVSSLRYDSSSSSYLSALRSVNNLAGAVSAVSHEDNALSYDFSHSADNVLSSSSSSSSFSNFNSIKELSEHVSNHSFSQGSNYSSDNSRSVNIPAVNLTVNVSGSDQGQDSETLAQLIAAKVREVFADMANLEERVAFS